MGHTTDIVMDREDKHTPITEKYTQRRCAGPVAQAQMLACTGVFLYLNEITL